MASSPLSCDRGESRPEGGAAFPFPGQPRSPHAPLHVLSEVWAGVFRAGFTGACVHLSAGFRIGVKPASLNGWEVIFLLCGVV